MTWPERAHAAELTQRTIAELIGYTEDGVSRGIRHDPVSPPIAAVIAAWELMTPDQRRAWLAALAVPPPAKRGRPRKASGVPYTDRDGFPRGE